MDGDDHGVLWVWTVSELFALVVLFGLLVGSLTGRSAVFASYDRTLRLAGLVVVTVELLIPVVVFLDLRRRPDEDTFWMHVAAMPGVNVFGLLAYIVSRNDR